MNEDNRENDSEMAPEENAPPTQAQLYDDLRRIGQLEDQKQAIQEEINERTERLRNAVPHLDTDSLLYAMLTATIAKSQPAKKSAKKSAKKTVKKKTK